MSFWNKEITSGGSRKTNSFLSQIVAFLVFILVGYLFCDLLWNTVTSPETLSFSVIEAIKTLTVFYTLELLFLYASFGKKIPSGVFIFLSFPLVVAIFYLANHEISSAEKGATTTILQNLFPSLLPHVVYITLATGVIFEVFLRLYGLQDKSFGEKIKKHPYLIRVFFVLLIIFIAGIIKIMA